MKEKILAVVMVCILGIGASACGATGDAESKPESGAVVETSEASAADESVSEESIDTSEDSESAGESESASAEESNPFAELEGDYSVQIPIYVVSHLSINSSSSKSETNYYYANHVFDEDGHLLSYEESENEKRWDAYTIEYDDQWNVVRLVEDNANSSLSEVTEYEYDEKGNRIKSTTTSLEDPSDVNVNQYEYDDNGFVIKSSNAESGNTSEYSYEFDNNGRVVKVSEYRDGVIRSENEYEYDAANKISKTIDTSYKDGNKTSVWEAEITTDPYGHIIQADSKQTFSSDGGKSSQDRKMYYEIGGHKTINSSDMDRIESTDKWLPINEIVAIPTPDSVISGYCEKVEGGNENEYKYILNSGEFDVNCFDYYNRCYKDRLANTVQTTPNEALWIYTGALSQVLGYEVDELDNGKYVVSIDGFASAELQYEFVDDNYYLTVTLS